MFAYVHFIILNTIGVITIPFFILFYFFFKFHCDSEYDRGYGGRSLDRILRARSRQKK